MIHAVVLATALRVSNPWSRPATGTGVAYLTVTNTSGAPDRLVGVTSPVAAQAELHESVATTMAPTSGGMGSMNGMPAGNAVMSMHPVASIAIPAHRRVQLKPGGYHVMLIGLHHDLRAGQSFPLRLHFARSGWRVVTVHVRPV